MRLLTSIVTIVGILAPLQGCRFQTIPCTTLPGVSQPGFFDGSWSITMRCIDGIDCFEPRGDRERLVQIEILQGRIETVILATGEELGVEGGGGSIGRAGAASSCDDSAGWDFTIPALALEDFAPRGSESYVLQFSLNDEDVTEDHFRGRIDIQSQTGPSEPRYGFRWTVTFTRDPSE